MKVKIVPYTCLCELSTFNIDGREADYEDFVEKYDHDEENAPDYGCGDMRCDQKEPTQKVLDKYGITDSEFYEIAEKLCSALDFGCCAWCS